MSRTCPECQTQYDDEILHCPEDGLDLSTVEPDDELIGRSIGSYRVIKPLGKGGMGAVYMAEHPVIGSRWRSSSSTRSTRPTRNRRPLLQRSAGRERHRPRQHPQDPRPQRHRGQPALLHHGVPARQGPPGSGEAGRTDSARGDRADPAASVRGAAGGARAQDHPPRPEAGQRLPDRPQGKEELRQGGGLRHRQAHRRAGPEHRQDADRHGDGHAGVHVAGAGGRHDHPHRRPQRHLLAGLHDVPDGDREAPVPGLLLRRGADRPPAAAAAADPRDQSSRCPRRTKR